MKDKNKMPDYELGFGKLYLDLSEKESGFKKVIKEVRMLIADYLLLAALKLYPKGESRSCLAQCLFEHFKILLCKPVFIDPDKEKQAEIIKNRDGL